MRTQILIIILLSSCSFAQVTVRQLTFNGTGGAPRENPGIPCASSPISFTLPWESPVSLPNGWVVWDERTFPYPGSREHRSFLYANNGTETVLLDQGGGSDAHQSLFSITYDAGNLTWLNRQDDSAVRSIGFYNGTNIFKPQQYAYWETLGYNSLARNADYALLFFQQERYIGNAGSILHFEFRSQFSILSLEDFSDLTGSQPDGRAYDGIDFSTTTQLDSVSFLATNVQPYENGFLVNARADYYWADESITNANELFFIEIPEPATLLLLGLGGVMLRRRAR